MHFLLDRSNLIQIQSLDTFSHPAVVHYGLDNQGATCYLNSILQVLYMTTEIHDRFETTLLFCCRKSASLHIYIYIYAVYIHTHMHCVKKTLTTTLSEGWTNHKTQTESWRKSLKLWKRKRAKRKISRNVCKLKMVGSFDSGGKKLTFTRRTDKILHGL